MTHGDSWAFAAPSPRGRARNVTPNAFTKHAAARALVNANRAPATGNRNRTRASGDRWKPKRNAWKRSHSLTKPFRRGRPEMAAEPTRKNRAVHGMRFARPPMSSMWRVPVAITTPPAPRKSRPLKTAWFRTW